MLCKGKKKFFKSEFGKEFMVDDVISLIFLMGKIFLIIGVNLGIGFELMCVLLKYGVYVVGMVCFYVKVEDVCVCIVGEVMLIVCDFFNFELVVECVVEIVE